MKKLLLLTVLLTALHLKATTAIRAINNTDSKVKIKVIGYDVDDDKKNILGKVNKRKFSSSAQLLD